MKTIRPTSFAAVLAALLAFNVPVTMAQDPTPSATPAASAAVPPSPAGSPADKESFRQRMNERLKTALKASDEEWSIIQPLLEKVQTKQREAMGGRFGALFGDRRGGGNRPGRPDGANRPTPAEVEALKAALEADDTSPAEIKAKLEAVRAVRKKAADELTQAQEELRKVLTQRQEASLVMVGILE